MKRSRNEKLTLFEARILKLVKKVPREHVTTYRLLAKAAGSPSAGRAAGNALNKNPKPIKVPCHRVVRSDGKIGGYRLGAKKKWSLLREEGVEFNKNKIKNLRKILYKF